MNQCYWQSILPQLTMLLDLYNYTNGHQVFSYTQQPAYNIQQLISQHNSYKNNLLISSLHLVCYMCAWVSVNQSIVLRYSPFSRNMSRVSRLRHGTLPVSFDCSVVDTFSVGYPLLLCYFAVVWVLLLYLFEGQFRHHNHLQFVNLCQVAIIWLLAELLMWCPLFHWHLLVSSFPCYMALVYQNEQLFFSKVP